MLNISKPIVAHMAQKTDNDTSWILDNVHSIVILTQNITAISCHLQALAEHKHLLHINCN